MGLADWLGGIGPRGRNQAPAAANLEPLVDQDQPAPYRTSLGPLLPMLRAADHASESLSGDRKRSTQRKPSSTISDSTVAIMASG